jgi:hypothetical protein
MQPEVVPDQKLRIGWSWGSPDGWILHRNIKDRIWDMLNGGKFDLKTLISFLSVKEEWLEIRENDKVPINYHLLLFIWDNYKSKYKTFKPPILYRLGVNKLGIIILTLYREDSAYTERIGGAIQYIMDHEEDWPKGDKEARIMALQDLKQWWWEEDWRERGKDRLAMIFDFIIDQYEKEPFVTLTIDYWINNLLANKKNWDNAQGWFKPECWYPRKKGIINYIVHGRKS